MQERQEHEKKVGFVYRKPNKLFVPRRLLILALIFILLAIFSNIFIDVFGWKSGKDTQIEIHKNTSVMELSQILYDNNIINSAVTFKLFYELQSFKVHFGKFTVARSMSYSKLIKTFMRNRNGWLYKIRKKFLPKVKIVVPEGFNLRQIASTLLEKKLITDTQSFLDEVQGDQFDYEFLNYLPTDRPNRLEGYLFPATYDFVSDITIYEIIDDMLATFNNKFNNHIKNEFEIYKNNQENLEILKNLDDVIKLASIVEKETANSEERRKVASVYLNRLNRKDNLRYLQSCPTVNYLFSNPRAYLSVNDTKIDSPYNTYVYPGLPIGPICSPSVDSIMAVLHPAYTDFLFFSGRETDIKFSKTYQEHLDGVS